MYGQLVARRGQRVDVLSLRVNEDGRGVGMSHCHVVEHRPVDSLLGTNNDHQQHDGADDDDGSDDTTRDSAGQSGDVETASKATVDTVVAACADAGSLVGLRVGHADAVGAAAVVGADRSSDRHSKRAQVNGGRQVAAA